MNTLERKPLTCILVRVDDTRGFYRDLFVKPISEKEEHELKIRDWRRSKELDDMIGKPVKIFHTTTTRNHREFHGLCEINLLSDLQKQDAVIKDLKNKEVI